MANLKTKGSDVSKKGEIEVKLPTQAKPKLDRQAKTLFSQIQVE